jgi:CRISPR-associated protein Cmr4
MEQGIYFLHCLSPLHVGSGAEGDYIDMPIAREAVAQLPFVPGSAVKGVLRQAYRSSPQPNGDVHAIFGPETDSAGDHAGALQVGDANLFVMPVNSFFGTWAYVTSPHQLRKLSRDWRHFHASSAAVSSLPAVTPLEDESTLRVVKDSVLMNQSHSRTLLNDLDFTAAEDDTTSKWANFLAEKIFPTDEVWQACFRQRFCVVNDFVFAFLCQVGTEVRTRVRIDSNTRTVAERALWTEENLPAEAILWGGLNLGRNTKDANAKLTLDPFKIVQRLQLGGNASIGNGQVSWSFA